MAQLADKILKTEGAGRTINKPASPTLIKKRVNVTLSTIITRGDVINNEADIEKLLNQIRSELKSRLSSDTELTVH